MYSYHVQMARRRRCKTRPYVNTASWMPALGQSSTTPSLEPALDASRNVNATSIDVGIASHSPCASPGHSEGSRRQDNANLREDSQEVLLHVHDEGHTQ